MIISKAPLLQKHGMQSHPQTCRAAFTRFQSRPVESRLRLSKSTKQTNKWISGALMNHSGNLGNSPSDDYTPNLLQEYQESCAWPPYADEEACARFLSNSTAAARTHIGEEAAFYNQTALEMQFNKMWLLLRVGPDEEAIDWWRQAPHGDILFVPRFPYFSEHYHSFGNASSQADKLFLGTTHVAIGFLDLGGLCAADIMREPEVGDGGPLRYVGYDSSPYSVAKTLVMLQMIHDGADVDQLLQVWMSSTWTTDTLAAFHAAVNQLLGNSTPEQSRSRSTSMPMTDAVRSLLKYWQQHTTPIPVQTSFKIWLESFEIRWSIISNFKRKDDRLALCRYLMTGEPQSTWGEVGSVTMCAVPKASYSSKADDECFLQTLPFEELMEQCKKPGMNIVLAGVAMARERLARLCTMIRSGDVQVELHHAAIEPTEHEVLTSIRNKQPHTMSWSNVLDYFLPSEAWLMMHSCSAAAGTLHYMYSMNWAKDVKGASVLDWFSMPGVPHRQAEAQATRMFRDAKKRMTAIYGEKGWNDVLVPPVVALPRSLVDHVQRVKLAKTWVDAFVSVGLRTTAVTDVESSVPKPLYILQRVSDVLELQFKIRGT